MTEYNCTIKITLLEKIKLISTWYPEMIKNRKNMEKSTI